MNKIILLIITALILVNVSIAIEQYFSLELNHYDGIITFRGVNVLAGAIPEAENRGEYKIRLVSFYNTILREQNFDVEENGDFTLYIPYNKEAKEIAIFKDNERIFHYDVAAFADVCGDNICQLHESYENCKEDCPSGARDDFCDIMVDGKCDPDCGVELDADCTEKEEHKEERIKEYKVKEISKSATEGTADNEKNSLFIVYVVTGIIIALMIVVAAATLLSRHRVKKGNQQLLDYIRKNLDMGYSPEMIKYGLVKQGFDVEEIDRKLSKN